MVNLRLGITFIEIILVVAIFSIIAASVIPIGAQFITKADYYTSKDNVVGTIRKAQGYSMDRKLGYIWGVCHDGTNLKLYGGNAGNNCNSNLFEEVFPIPSSVTINGISDTTFSINGEPNPANGLNSISITSNSDTTTISVNRAGGINVQ